MLQRRRFRRLVGAAAALVAVATLLWAVSAVASRRYQVWAALPVENSFSGSMRRYRYVMVNGPLEGHESRVARSLAAPDPWGQPWSDGPPLRGQGPRRVWSNGPDGVDEGGRGDDIPVDGDMELVAVAPLLGTLAALLLLWLAAVLRALGGPRGPEAWHDAVRAAVATTLAVALLGLFLAAVKLPRALRRWEGLVVPPPVAITGAVWLVLSLVVLAWRVRPTTPRRRRVRHGRVAAACVAAVVAGGAATHGLVTWTREQPQRAIRLRAQLGHQAAVEAVLAGDQADMEAYLARDPQVEWHRVGGSARQGVARLGPAANRYMALALRWDGGVAPLRDAPWRHLLAHDVDFKALSAAVAAEPARYPALLLTSPRLVAGLLGTRRALVGLRALREQAAFDPTDDGPGLSGPDAAETRLRATAAIEAVTGADDVWVVVDVLGLTPVDWRLRCAARLDDGPETEWLEQPSYGRIMVAIGPLPASPAGRVLHLRDLSGRERELALPALPAGSSVWVDALMRSGRLVARPIQRPE